MKYSSVDSGLIEGLNKGDQSSLKSIFSLFNKPLLYFAMQYVKNHQVAEDILSEIFIKVWQKRTSFNDLEKLQAFLYISVKNSCLNHLRSRSSKLNDPLSIDAWDELASEDPDALNKIIKSELLNAIERHMNELPEKQKMVFIMSFFQDRSPEEISRELNISISAVYANKSRAIGTLKSKFGKDDTLTLLLFFISNL